MSIDVSRMSKLGFGMMRLPEADGNIDHNRVCGMVDKYLSAGFNYFDTAYIYHSGTSEAEIRKALVKRYPRESFMLTDKLPVWMLNSPEDRDTLLDEQLQRCGVDYFDIYLLHSLEEGGNYENAVKYDCFHWLKEKKAEGKVRHIGFSFHGTPELLDKILTEHPEIEVVQIQLNYLDWVSPVVRSKAAYEVLRSHDVPILVMEPVKGGTLVNIPAEAKAMLQDAKADASIASWAMRFAGSLPGVMTVLSGMSTEEQVTDNLQTFGAFEPLNDAEQGVIERVREILVTRSTVQCTACRYCYDGCPAGINIPEIFKVLNDIRMNGKNDRAQGYYSNIAGHDAKAKDCMECGQCEAVCPQHLGVIELLREASRNLDGVRSSAD